VREGEKKTRRRKRKGGYRRPKGNVWNPSAKTRAKKKKGRGEKKARKQWRKENVKGPKQTNKHMTHEFSLFPENPSLSSPLSSPLLSSPSFSHRNIPIGHEECPLNRELKKNSSSSPSPLACRQERRRKKGRNKGKHGFAKRSRAFP
jgi:hypothetical protein